ncbi:MAG: galactose mutarotase [Saccharofermentans sp.]|nr:galactose mutarotase [Saccharofermentans sp.]
MSITIQDYLSASNPDKYQGISRQYTLTVPGGYEASIINYGALITNLMVPDKDGNAADIMLGLKGLDEYMASGSNHGSIVGRSANRISGAKFNLNGTTYELPANDGPNNLHSGNPAYQNVFWEGRVISEAKANLYIHESGIAGIAECDGEALLLSYVSPDGACGFPGNLDTKVMYCWLEDKTLLILYIGKSDKDTVFAPTNHAYFNLAGHNAGSTGEQLLTINADSVTLKDEFNCPDGRIMDVEGTVFDCREARFVSELNESEDPQITMSMGIDQNWCLKTVPGTFSFAGAIEDPKSGRVMEVFTDMPGIQIYGGNHLGGTDQKGDVPYTKYGAVCLEAQMFPNAINIPEFDSPVIKAGETVFHACGYRFV